MLLHGLRFHGAPQFITLATKQTSFRLCKCWGDIYFPFDLFCFKTSKLGPIIYAVFSSIFQYWGALIHFCAGSSKSGPISLHIDPVQQKIPLGLSSECRTPGQAIHDHPLLGC